MKSKLSTTKDPDLARWCAALAEGTAAIDTVPPGWFTVSQLAVDKAYETVRRLVRHLVSIGRAEVKTFRIRCGKVVRPVPHYRLK